ncbi:acetolactate synthase small subunit [Demequina sp. NBRC 110057]|uniref:acetolactate synthase small subunit n=1 Tax=unclassified Demequina TaxID=2620311 RepID=UPI000A04FD15|nr:acetolactate synthase small subunit [Demequina sp. NBRC 110057]
MTTHTLSVLVENKPGVLARVSGLFSRRAFNIHSLAVGQTEYPEISRITVVVDVDELPLEQVTKQLNKLVHVLKIVELERDKSVQRDLILVKVRADARQRADVLQIVDLFRAHVVDVSPDSLVIEAVGAPDKLQALLAALKPHDIREIVQSGTVAIGRGPRSITERAFERVSA